MKGPFLPLDARKGPFISLLAQISPQHWRVRGPADVSPAWRISSAATRRAHPPELDAAGEIRQGRGIGYPGAEPRAERAAQAQRRLPGGRAPRGTRGNNSVAV